MCVWDCNTYSIGFHIWWAWVYRLEVQGPIRWKASPKTPKIKKNSRKPGQLEMWMWSASSSILSIKFSYSKIAVFWTGIRSKNGYKITNIYGVNLGINTCVLVPVLFVFVVELQYSQCGQEATNDDVFRWRRYFPAFFFLILSWSEALEFYISVAVVGFSSALQFYSLLLLIVYFIILEKTK